MRNDIDLIRLSLSFAARAPENTKCIFTNPKRSFVVVSGNTTADLGRLLAHTITSKPNRCIKSKQILLKIYVLREYSVNKAKAKKKLQIISREPL